MTAVLLVATVAACGDDAPPVAQPSQPVISLGPDPDAARSALAARAALAIDRKYAALYNFEADDEPTRAVVATVALDGSWRVDIPGGAQGGVTDVSIVQNSAGVFQCSLASATNPITPACVRVANTNAPVPAKYDPKVEHVFRQWLAVFTDPQAAISVGPAQPLTTTPGSECFSVDSNAAGMNAPVDVGIYCYAADGTLTGAKVDFGTLTIASQPAAAPPTVDLPGAIVTSDPMGMTSPPPTTPPTTPPVIAPTTPAGVLPSVAPSA